MTQIPSESPYPKTAKDAVSAFENTAIPNGLLTTDRSSQPHLSQFSEEESAQSQFEKAIWETEATQVQKSQRRWWGSLSIRTKATALAVVLGTVPVLAIGALAYSSANKSITDQVKQQEINRATQLGNEVDLFMTDRLSDIKLLGQSPILTNPRVSDATPRQQLTDLFDRYVKLYGVYNGVALFNLDGETIAQAQGPATPNHKTRDYFIRVLKTGEATINPPSISRTTGTLSMHLAAPVKNVDTGETTGVVRFQLPVAGLNKIAEEYGTQGDKYFLIDNSGKYFLAAGSSERVGKPAAEHFARFSELQAAKQSGSVIDVNPDNGSEQLLTYVPLNDLGGLSNLDFGVLIASDTKVAFAAQRQLLVAIVLGTAITSLIVSAVAADLANRATRPIRAAADAVNQIGQGDLDTRLEFSGNDEIGVLGSNINSMAAQLQSSLAAQAFEATQERVLTAAKGSGVLRRIDLQDIFAEAVAEARQVLNLDRVVIYRFDTGSGRGIIAESVDVGWASALENNVNDTCIPSDLRQAYLQGRVVATNDVSEADWHPEHLKLIDRLQVKANLVVPILASNQLFGLLIAHSCANIHEWQESEISFLKRLGTELGLSIYRVELLEQTTNLAAEQQQLKEALQRRALELLQEVDPISRGDLTTRARVTADEIGTIADSYNATVDNLRSIVVQVQNAANQVVSTTTANEVSIETLSVEALRQAEEIAAALGLVQQMADAVQTVALNAEQAEAAVQQAAQTVEEGDEVMNRTVAGIQVIRSTVADTAKKVKHLGESSQKISKVVELISAFAAQTNMLALNASIEASRAGEEGRGFGVVANEVRALARQSAEATEEIRSLVASIQSETNEVVNAMESGIEQVVTGTRLVDETRQSLNKITAASLQISGLVAAIAQSTVVQSEASDSVTQTMMDVAAIANKTSTEVGQVSSSFEQLRKVAQTLQAGVGQFKV